MSKTYIVKPKYKKSSFSNEYWTNIINDKLVTLKVTVQWKRSIFSINLNEEEKKKVKKSYNLMLSDYDYSFIETEDHYDRFFSIQNEINYTARELKMIYNTIYEDIDELLFDEIFMKENGWNLSKTTYEISGGVELIENI